MGFTSEVARLGSTRPRAAKLRHHITVGPDDSHHIPRADPCRPSARDALICEPAGIPCTAWRQAMLQCAARPVKPNASALATNPNTGCQNFLAGPRDIIRPPAPISTSSICLICCTAHAHRLIAHLRPDPRPLDPTPSARPPVRSTRPLDRPSRRAVSRAQRGPRRSLQDGHDSRNGSAAHGPRDVPARILSERRLYAAFLPRGPSPAGFHSTGRSASGGGSRRRDRPQDWRDVCRLDHSGRCERRRYFGRTRRSSLAAFNTANSSLSRASTEAKAASFSARSSLVTVGM
ncbi:MAG: hypothetical protein K0R17_3536 [Rariglobus sp.]|nr:hypothetical protein [Rariglobus sp.]